MFFLCVSIVYNKYHSKNNKVFIEYFNRHNYKTATKGSGLIIFCSPNNIQSVIKLNIRIKSILKNKNDYLVFAYPEGSTPRTVLSVGNYCSHIK